MQRKGCGVMRSVVREKEDPAVYGFGCKRGVQRYNGMLKSHRLVRNLVSWLVELTPSDMGLRK